MKTFRWWDYNTYSHEVQADVVKFEGMFVSFYTYDTEANKVLVAALNARSVKSVYEI